MTRNDAFTAAYIMTALWASDDDDGVPLDRNYTEADLAPECLEKMRADCEQFQAECAELITAGNCLKCGPDFEYDGRAGHDFWLTRNRHGAGFWDGDWQEPAATRLTDASHFYGECYLYVGDDGRIYC